MVDSGIEAGDLDEQLQQLDIAEDDREKIELKKKVQNMKVFLYLDCTTLLFLHYDIFQNVNVEVICYVTNKW